MLDTFAADTHCLVHFISAFNNASLEVKENGEFSLTKDLINSIPNYAILSHTRGDDDEEVTFKNLTEALLC